MTEKKLYIRDMKTKLLRKLREKAKNEYWVEERKNDYSLKKIYILMGELSVGCGVFVPYEINTYENFEDAKISCDNLRYDYIEDYIKKRKKRPLTKIVY